MKLSKVSMTAATYILLFPHIRLVPRLDLNHEVFFHPGILQAWERYMIVSEHNSVREVTGNIQLLYQFLHNYVISYNTYCEDCVRRKRWNPMEWGLIRQRRRHGLR